jgi:hypothetical protein
MQITHIADMEGCLQGTILKEVSWDKSLSEEAIQRLCGLGRSQYLRHFPRPFFRVDTPDGIQVKGILGGQSMQILFKQADSRIMEAFHDRLQKELFDL